MKKLTFSLIGAAALMLTACSNEEVLDNAANEGMVTFTIGIQQNATRDLNTEISQGKMIDRLRYVVLDENNTYLFDKEIPASFTNTNSSNQRYETVDITLVVGKTYHIVFFADNNGSGYTITNDGVLEMNYSEYKTNDESRDAFYKYESVKISKGVTPAPVILNRPFAQINVASTAEDVSAAQAAGVVVEESKYEITGNVYSKLNMLTGVASDPIGVNSVIDFAKAARPNGQISIEGTPYEWLSMVYVLPEAEGDILPMVKFSFDENPDAREYTSIPVKRNFRTNIVGNILTQTNEFTVILDTDFNTPDFNVWDGSVSEPSIDPGTGDVLLTSASELAYVAQNCDEYKNKTVTLEADLDLNNIPWTPIGSSSEQFKGDFNGQGHVIKNLNVEGAANNNVGLFGQTTNGTISNVIIENAKIEGYLNVGVISGNPWTANYENITVRGLVQIDGGAYVGIFGKNAYGNFNNITINVDEGSYVRSKCPGYRNYVGSVIGFSGEGNSVYSNIYSNLDVYGDTANVGGLFGIAHYGNTYINCVYEGNVVMKDCDDEADAKLIGGIASTWHNQTGKTVTFTNCKCTGTLKSILKNGTVLDFTETNDIVGPRYGSGTGRLIIDGVDVTDSHL